MPEKPETILIVSPDESVIRFLGALLKDTNFSLIKPREAGAVPAEVKRLNPTMAILDADHMPTARLMDLCRILADNPIPVFLVTRDAERSRQTTAKGLSIGAVDVLALPGGAPKLSPEERRRMIKAISAGAALNVSPVSYNSAIRIVKEIGMEAETGPAAGNFDALSLKRRFDAVGVAISTGGPNALSHLIPLLPADFPVPMLIVQHIIPDFINGIVARLNQNCSVSVKIAEQREPLAPGVVYFAPDKTHLMVKNIGGRLYTHLSAEPSDLLFCPSADVLFKSMAEVCGPRCMAVIMTGMGRDGVDGVRCVKKAGGATMAQDSHSSVIYGMARVAVDAKLIDRVVPLDRIAGEVYRLMAEEAAGHSKNESVSS